MINFNTAPGESRYAWLATARLSANRPRGAFRVAGRVRGSGLRTQSVSQERFGALKISQDILFADLPLGHATRRGRRMRQYGWKWGSSASKGHFRRQDI